MLRFLFLALLAAVAPSQTVLRTFTTEVPWTLDPHMDFRLEVLRYYAQIFESPLEMRFDKDGHCDIRPALSGLPQISEDGRTLELMFAPGVRFQDDPCFPEGKGREVVPQDLVFCWKRIADPETRSPYWGSFLQGRVKGLDAWRERVEKHKFADYDAPVEGLVVKGRKLTIKLTGVYPQLPALLTQPWASVLPREAVKLYGSGISEHPVGTGPFRYAGKDALGTFSFVRNPTYRIPGRPYADEVRFEVASLDDRTERFLNGDLEVLDVWPQNAGKLLDAKGRLKSLLQRKGMQLYRSPPIEVSYFFFSFRNEILKKRGVREAIALAVNRRPMADIMADPDAPLADSPIPPTFPESAPISDTPYAYEKQDVERAKKVLAEAGYPGGKGLPEFIIDAPGAVNSEKDQDVLKLLIADLAAIGIKSQLRAETFEKFLERAKRGDLQIGWVRWYADYPDAENFLLMFRSHDEDPLVNWNYGAFKNEEFDYLYDKMRNLYPGPERTALIVKMVEIIRREIPWVFIYYPRQSRVIQRGVLGYGANVLNYSLRDVRVPRQRKR